MNIYSFRRLIEKYQVSGATVTTHNQTDGHHDDDGYWVPASKVDVDIPFCGAIIPYSTNAILSSGGRYSSADRQIFSTMALNLKDIITYRGRQYLIESDTEYDEYSDFYVYTGKWVEAFDKTQGNSGGAE